jgi:hypothetical protein
MHSTFYLNSVEETGIFGDTGADVTIIFKWIFNRV